MSLYFSRFIAKLKRRADIAVVIQDHVLLKRAGATYTGLCPFHAEHTPSFHVEQRKGFFHCFGCGASGDVITFVQRQHNVDFDEAVRLLANRLGLPLPESKKPDV